MLVKTAGQRAVGTAGNVTVQGLAPRMPTEQFAKRALVLTVIAMATRYALVEAAVLLQLKIVDFMLVQALDA